MTRFIVRPLPDANSRTNLIGEYEDINKAICAAHEHYAIYQEDTGVYDASNQNCVYTANTNSQYVLVYKNTVLGQSDSAEILIPQGDDYLRNHPGIDPNDMTIVVANLDDTHKQPCHVVYVVSKLGIDNQPEYNYSKDKFDMAYLNPYGAIEIADNLTAKGYHRYCVTAVVLNGITPVSYDVMYRSGDSRNIEDFAVYGHDDMPETTMSFEDFASICAAGNLSSTDGTAVLYHRHKPITNISIAIETGAIIITDAATGAETKMMPHLFYIRFIANQADDFRIAMR